LFHTGRLEQAVIIEVPGKTGTPEDRSLNPFDGINWHDSIESVEPMVRQTRLLHYASITDDKEMKTADVDALIEIVKTFDSNGSIDVNLSDGERTETSFVETCGIRIVNHNFVADGVISEMATSSILTQIVAINESLPAFTDEIVVSKYGDR
jgi:hypothetical protein